MKCLLCQGCGTPFENVSLNYKREWCTYLLVNHQKFALLFYNITNTIHGKKNAEEK